MARSSGHVSEHIGRWTRTLPSPALDTGEGVAELAVDSATSTLKFGAPGAVTKEVMDLSSAQTVTGNKSFTGTTAFTGEVTSANIVYGLRRLTSIVDAAGPTALPVINSGQVIIGVTTSGTEVFTLPAAATAGLTFTFVCGAGAAGGEIHVGVVTGDNIIGKTHGAENATGLVSTVSTGLLKNTAASNVVGDFCTLVSDGVTTWYMIAVAGVWSVT